MTAHLQPGQIIKSYGLDGREYTGVVGNSGPKPCRARVIHGITVTQVIYIWIPDDNGTNNYKSVAYETAQFIPDTECDPQLLDYARMLRKFMD